MKYLKIERNKGFYTVDGKKWSPVDEINKQDLMVLLDISLTNDFEMDEYQKDNIENKAHQIIYKKHL